MYFVLTWISTKIVFCYDFFNLCWRFWLFGHTQLLYIIVYYLLALVGSRLTTWVKSLVVQHDNLYNEATKFFRIHATVKLLITITNTDNSTVAFNSINNKQVSNISRTKSQPRLIKTVLIIVKSNFRKLEHLHFNTGLIIAVILCYQHLTRLRFDWFKFSTVGTWKLQNTMKYKTKA